MDEDLESSFREFWKHVSIPDGYYTGEAKMACLHAQGVFCSEARRSQIEVSDDEAEAVPNDPEAESVIQGLTEQGGIMLGHPAIREGHRVALIARPIPEEFKVEQCPDGDWEASMVTESGEEEDEKAEDPATDGISKPRILFSWSLTHKVKGATKNEAVRNLILLANTIPANMSQEPVMAVVISPDISRVGPSDIQTGPNSRN